MFPNKRALWSAVIFANRNFYFGQPNYVFQQQRKKPEVPVTSSPKPTQATETEADTSHDIPLKEAITVAIDGLQALASTNIDQVSSLIEICAELEVENTETEIAAPENTPKPTGRKRKRKSKKGTLVKKVGKARGPYCGPRTYSAVVVSILSGDENATRENLRVGRKTFSYVAETLVTSQKRNGWGKEFEVAIFLSWLVNGTHFQNVCQTFNVPRTTVFGICNRILKDIVDRRCDYIKVPKESEIPMLGIGFSTFGESQIFAACAGALGGCHINTQCPSHLQKQPHQPMYFINLQGIVDHEGRFIDIFAEFPDDVLNADVLNEHSMWYQGKYPPQKYFIIGDESYACRQYPTTVITPIREPKKPKQITFNQHLKQAGMISTAAFTMMRTRWQNMFTRELGMKMEKGMEVLLVCAILHNICLDKDDMVNVEEAFKEPTEPLHWNREVPLDDAEACKFRNNLVEILAFEQR